MPVLPPRAMRRPVSSLTAQLRSVGVAILAGTLLAGGAFTGARAADPPNPDVAVSLNGQALIGAQVAFDVAFDNVSSSETGYGPYVDLRFPLGADGDDGLVFTGATYLGSPVTSTQLTADGAGCVTHPYAVDPTGARVVVCGMAPGQAFVVLRLPFGSYTPDQPATDIRVTAGMSSYADAGTPLAITARGGFQFGATPIADPATDPSIMGTSVTATVTPTVITLSKQYSGPESETATGPNYPRQYTVTARIAAGQVVTDLELSDALPGNLQFVSYDGSTPASSAIAMPSTTVPGGTLTRRFASVTGSGGADAAFELTFHVPLVDQASSRVVDPVTGAAGGSVDTATAAGTWVPLDPRDAPGPVTAGPVTHSLADRSIAVQKSVAVAPGGDVAPLGVLNPGDTLEWTMAIQVSDVFAFENVHLHDKLADGTRLDATFTPTLAVNGNGYASAAAPFDPANMTLGPVDAGGITLSELRISDELVTRGLSGDAIGGCVDPAGGTGTPDCGTFNDGPTTATVVLRSIVQDTYVDGRRIVEGDGLGNETSVTGDVLHTDTLTPTGLEAGDGSAAVASPGSSAAVEIPRGELEKTIYAIDGSTSFSAPTHIKAGDTITFRLKQTFPTTRTEDFLIRDFLPLPIMRAAEVTTLDPTASAAIPPAGTVKYGPDDTFHLLPLAPAPVTSTDALANSVALTYGDYAAPAPGAASVVDLLFTVTVTEDAFADGLLLTNLARSHTRNSVGTEATADSIIQFILDHPVVLGVTKGAVSGSRGDAVFTPATTGPRAFDAPGSAACAAWSGGPITSAGLGTDPIDSDVDGLDAGDLVRFAITMENTGHGDAYDVVISDNLPAGLVVPAGGLNLCATRGDGSALDIANAGGTGLLDGGILLTGAGGAPAAAAGQDANDVVTADGSNVIVVTFDLEVAATARPAVVIDNTGSLEAYASAPGAENHLVSPLTDSATTTLRPIGVAKDVIDSDRAHTTLPAVAIGEIVTYQVVVTVPEGTTGPASLTDALPAGLAFVACDGISASGALSTTLAGGFDDACTDPTNPAPIPASGAGGGRNAIFDLGTITNADRDDATDETITITYRASVINVAGNVRGTALVNAATVAWNDGTTNRSATDGATAVRVVEPRLVLTKTASPTTGDADDVVTFQIVVTNPVAAPNGSTAFEASLTDTIPSGLTYVAGSLQTTAGTAPASLGESGGVISATWTTFPAGGTTTLQYQATAGAGVTPGAVITNTASSAWSSLPGTVGALSAYNDVSAERTGRAGDPGGAANTYTATDPATFTVTALAPVKSIVTTSEASSSGTNVVIGEIVRYRLVVQIPEGSSPVLTFTDQLPAGLSYLAGTAKVALVSSGGGLISNTLTDGDIAKVGNQATLASITPTYTLPGGAVTGGVGDGADPVFALGTLTNTENDADLEYAVIEFNALVGNVAGNVAGTNRDNGFQVHSSAVLAGTSATVRVTVRHPVLAVDKVVSIVPTDGGDALRYTITMTNTGGATAFDVDLRDTLDADLVMGALGIGTGGTVTGVTDLSNAPTNSVHVRVTSIAVGGSVTITVDATVVADVDAGESIPNTATGTWTSLPGNGTDPNGTGSIVPGAAGSTTGERTGTGGVNSYTDPGAAAAALNAPSIDKLAISPTGYAIGAEPVFTLRVRIPEGTARSLTVTDTLPAGLVVTGQATVVSAAASGGDLTSDFAGTLPAFSVTASPAGSAGGALTLAFGNVVNPADGLATNDSFLVRVSTQVANTAGNQAGTVRSNTASLTYLDPETATTTVSAPTPRTVTVIEPVVVLDKTASPATPLFGAEVTYTLVISNGGPASTADAFELELADILPAGLTYVAGSLAHTAGTAPATLSESGGTISASWATLALGDASTLTYRATVGSPSEVGIGQSLVNGVDAAWTSLSGTVAGERTGTDGTGGLNDYVATDQAGVTVGGIDPGITKTDGVATATAGATLTYTLGISNGGNLAATGVVVTETVPAHTTFRTSGSSAGWSCADGAVAGSTCTLTIASLAGGASVSLTFVVAVDAPLPPGVTQVTNTATVADDGTHGPDPDAANNSATDTDTVPVADLSLTKTIDETAPNVGDTVTFTVVVSNAGPSAAPSVVVHDLLPAGLTFSSATPTQGSYVAGSGTWTVGTINAGGSATLTIDAVVATSGATTNTAEVSAAGSSDPDSTPGNGDPDEDDIDHASLTPMVADLAVVKTVSNANPDPGDDVTYTITLSNLGPDGATGVTLHDALPAGVSFVSATPSQGSYDEDTGTWDVGSVPVGADVATLAITVTVTSAGAITNTASVSHSDVFDPVAGNNTDSTGIDQILDLVVAKTVDEPAQDVGADVVFTVTVRNAGPNIATGVVVDDPLPAGLDFIAADGDGSYASGPGTWTVGTLTAGETATLRITATVSTPSPVTNTATVGDVDQPQTSTTNDTDSATVTPPRADLAVVKTVDDSRPAVGETATWTITVTNNGPDAATGVSVADAIPAGLTLDGATASTGSYDAGTGTWTIGTMANGATETLVLATTVTVTGDRTNTATVRATTHDPDLDNNTDQAFLTTKQADIGVAKAVDDDTPAVGQVVTFTISATNNGPDPARRVVLRDRLPAGLAYVSDDAGGDYDPATGDWTVGNLAVGDTRTFHLDARVTTSGTITNTVVLHSLVEEDTVPLNNEATSSLEAPPAADLSLAKSSSPATVANGQDVTFTLTVTNHGPDGTTGVVVSDLLPAGLAYVSDDGGGAYDPGTGDWTVGDLAVDASASLQVTATVTQPGEIVNVAEITASGLPDPDSTPGNGDPGEDDRAQALVNADNRADLSLAKSVSTTTVVIGDTVVYTLTLRNAGPDRATGVVVSDRLPAGMTYVSHRGGSYDPDSGTWDVGAIAVGEVRTLRITVRVGKLGNQVNRAEIIASNAFDPDSVPNNGNRTEDDLAAAAVGGLRPSMPPTSIEGPGLGGASSGPDGRGLVLVLLVGAVLALLVRPRWLPRRP